MKRMLEPFVLSLIISAALVLAGFATVGLGWYGAAKVLDDFIQLPYLLSGGFVGLATIVTGMAIARIQLSRREAAIEIAQLDELTLAAAQTLASLKGQK